MATKLTLPRLLAIREALESRLAGEIETDIDRRDYETAADWAAEQYLKRSSRRPAAPKGK